MKALRNLTHNGVNYPAGTIMDHVEMVEKSVVDGHIKDLVAGKKPSDLPLTSHDLGVFADKMTQAEHDSLVAAGVITDNNDQPLPQPVDTKYLNYQIQEGDVQAEAERKAEQAANHAANVANNINPPEPAASQVVVGNPADAQAAIDKANQEAAAAAAVESAPADPVAAPEGV